MEKTVDILNRNKDKELIIGIINNALSNGNSLSFALNGKWGAGKSFFIKMLKEELDKNSFVFYYDAWMNNYYDEPLVGFLEEIRTELNSILTTKNVFSDTAKAVAKNVLESLTSFLDNIAASKIGIKPFKTIKGIKTFVDSCKTKGEISDEFNDFALIKKTKAIIIDSLNKLSKEAPVIFIIDELDRCIPTYALKVIERIHHISNNVSRNATILAIDQDQLRKIIESLYPHTVDQDTVVNNYMKKIIDFSYQLNNGDLQVQLSHFTNILKKYYDEKLINNNDDFDLNTLIRLTFANVEIRKCIKVINNMVAILDVMNHKEPIGVDVIAAEFILTWYKSTCNKTPYLSALMRDIKEQNNEFAKYINTNKRNNKMIYFDSTMGRSYLRICNTHNSIAWHISRISGSNYFYSNKSNVAMTPNAEIIIKQYVSILEKISL